MHALIILVSLGIIVIYIHTFLIKIKFSINFFFGLIILKLIIIYHNFDIKTRSVLKRKKDRENKKKMTEIVN